MYYAEKFENGAWYYKTTPSGKWTKMSYDQLSLRVLGLTIKNEELEDAVNSLRERNEK